MGSTSKQPIRTRYLGHVTGYQPVRDQYFTRYTLTCPGDVFGVSPVQNLGYPIKCHPVWCPHILCHNILKYTYFVNCVNGSLAWQENQIIHIRDP
eukprot:sb/3479309/